MPELPTKEKGWLARAAFIFCIVDGEILSLFPTHLQSFTCLHTTTIGNDRCLQFLAYAYYKGELVGIQGTARIPPRGPKDRPTLFVFTFL